MAEHEGEEKRGRRGLALADKETRQRVAAAGGHASHGGGRPRRRDSEQEANQPV